MPESKFTPAQAEELAAAFAKKKVDYLFIGKGGAILLGYPETTQDMDISALDDIIASKRATGREKDRSDLPRLEQFKQEFMRRRT
jgi:hypothetical protein